MLRKPAAKKKKSSFSNILKPVPHVYFMYSGYEGGGVCYNLLSKRRIVVKGDLRPWGGGNLYGILNHIYGKRRRKTRKHPKGYANERDEHLNPAPFLYQLWRQKFGAAEKN